MIRIAPAEALSRPRPPAPRRTVAKPRPDRLHTYLQLGDRLGAPARADGTLPADSPGHLAAADEASPCPADADPTPRRGPRRPRRRRPPPRRRRPPRRPRPPLPRPRRRLPPILGARSPRSSSSRSSQPPSRPSAAGRRAADGEERSGRSATSRSRPASADDDSGPILPSAGAAPAAPSPTTTATSGCGRRSQLVADGRTGRMCEHAAVPPLPPHSPVALAFGAFQLWRRLPPAQRRQMMLAARTHGPKIAAAVLAARRKPKP